MCDLSRWGRVTPDMRKGMFLIFYFLAHLSVSCRVLRRLGIRGRPVDDAAHSLRNSMEAIDSLSDEVIWMGVLSPLGYFFLWADPGAENPGPPGLLR